MRYVDIITHVQNIHKVSQPSCKSPEVMPVRAKDNHSIESQIINYHGGKPSVYIRITSLPTNQILGMYRAYAPDGKLTHSIITVYNKMTDCWHRYVTVKELTHIILSPTGSMDVQKEILSHIHKILHWVPLKEIDKDVPEESLAEYFAAELLVPYCHNDYLMDLDLTAYEVAQAFKVPEKLINEMRTDWYQELRKEAHAS